MPLGNVAVTVRPTASLGPALVVVAVMVAFVPAVTVAGLDSTRLTSAIPAMMVASVTVLLLVVESAVVAEAAKMASNEPLGSLAATFVVNTSVLVEPTATVEFVQVTTCPIALQVQPDVGVDTKLIAAGSVAVTVTPAASEGPIFYTETV
jgi:hypothetical protein